MGKNLFTEEGLKRLRGEIAELERFIKIDIAKDLQTAAAHGDLRENAEYQAAKEKQSLSMTRLRELKQRVHNADVVKKRDFPEDIVTLLKWVKIKDVESGSTDEFKILGDGDTDLDDDTISYTAPLAAALIGHKRGEVVDAELPRGVRQFEVLDFGFIDGI